MDTNHKNSEDQPRNINPKEAGNKEPAKAIKSQEKIKIDQSGLGRDQGQTPADEHIENRISQIDNETVKLQEHNENSKAPISKNEKALKHTESSDLAEYPNEINDTDVRDQHDSTTDWDAENSKTGRHK